MTTPPDSPALTLATAAALLRAAHPDAEVMDVLPRSGGQLSAVYEVRCADPAHAAVVKVYAEQWRWKQAKEVYVHGLLAGVDGWPGPAVLHHTGDGGPGGRAATVLGLLPGVPLSEASPAPGPDRTRALYRSVGAALATAHRLRLDGFGYVTTRVLDPVPDNGTYMRRQFARKLAEFAELGGEASLGRALGAFVARRGALLDHGRAPVLCHNDLHEGNVLVVRGSRGWRVSGVVDVENAVAADPVLDLAKTDYYAVRGDALKREALLAGYGPLPVAAGELEDLLALYRLYHALELWDWFASTGERAPLPGIAADLAELAEGGTA
ncbi:aminoglycoside phosphotransferase family protein [Kitasatospora sp. NPDC097643]|uniref:phosphotransferase family protein n=1 Tax=Kitasatospora sp. NPDC097643 TaxID=3157230 RepID=UPI003324B1C4